MKKAKDTFVLSASDLVGHLNCRHLTALDIAVANGDLGKPRVWNDPQLDALRERGFAHEKSYFDHLKAQGLEIIKIDGVDITDQAVAQTIKAMHAGKAVIAQAAFSSKGWCGRVDILRRVEIKSKLGAWSYEVIDTKLSRETKGATILQLSLYSDLLEQVQGHTPEYMYVVAPWSNYQPRQFRVHDYAAYYRHVKTSLERMVSSTVPLDTYPDPKEYCNVCRWEPDCDARRRKDDHLSLVAGISKLQTTELKQNKTNTASLLAEMPIPLNWKPERGSEQSYIRVREQARVQVTARSEKKSIFEVLPIKPGFGFNCLPEPSEGDIFLDYEGDTYVGEYGLEYLLGYEYKDKGDRFKYVCSWALNRSDEKLVLESFVDFAMARLAEHPLMHIYHYGSYDPSALKRLMGRYATREEEVDQMLRAGLFVDLQTITRHCIRASVESYSLKKLEQFYGYKRLTDLRTANVAIASVQSCLELNEISAITDESKTVVESYNHDDCASARGLRDWLEKLRNDFIKRGETISRPEGVSGEASENVTDWLKKIQELVGKLTQDIPANIEQRSREQQARWVLANILDWHRREQKAVWWEFFRLSDLSSDELLDEKAAISGLTYVGDAGGTFKAPIHRYKFPTQETELRGGESLHTVGGIRFGSVESISVDDRTVDIKKRSDSKDIHPDAVFAHDVVNSKELANSLVRLGEYVAQNGLSGQGQYRAARALLLRESPLIGGQAIRNSGEKTVDAAVRVALSMAGGIFPIQGPPGAGKTFTGAKMICELVRNGKKIGITANSHKVIRLLLNEVIKLAEAGKINLQCVQKPSEPEANINRLSFVKKNEELLAAISSGCHVAGATAWFWSRPDAMEAVDVLFVDEAAQVSLANVLSVAQAGKSVVLLGDPQQLDQPIQGSHPEGTDISALNYILEGEQTISPEKGLFLEETWRLHPRICEFTSEIFYDGKLNSKKGLDIQVIKSSGRLKGFGLRYIPVAHHGNGNSSPEEAKVISDVVKEILESKSTWVDHDGTERPVLLEDVLIITPYNAQKFEIQHHLPGANVGTVDKFQGQQAPIAIYSMATSSHSDAPRGMEFLYSLNRLNVATSRAKCLTILVSSPDVFEAECKTPGQMKLANAFCRYLEMTQS